MDSKNPNLNEAERMYRICHDLLAPPRVGGKEMHKAQHEHLVRFLINFTETYLNQNGRRNRSLTSDEMLRALSACVKWSLEEFTSRQPTVHGDI